MRTVKNRLACLNGLAKKHLTRLGPKLGANFGNQKGRSSSPLWGGEPFIAGVHPRFMSKEASWENGDSDCKTCCVWGIGLWLTSVVHAVEWHAPSTQALALNGSRARPRASIQSLSFVHLIFVESTGPTSSKESLCPHWVCHPYLVWPKSIQSDTVTRDIGQEET